jgi:hypothetical protein
MLEERLAAKTGAAFTENQRNNARFAIMKKRKLFEKPLTRGQALIAQPNSFWETNSGRILNSPRFQNILKRTTNKEPRFQIGFGPKSIDPGQAQFNALRVKKGNKYYGNLNVWSSPKLMENIRKSKNLTSLQQEALRRMIRSVKLNKNGAPRIGKNRIKLTSKLMSITNNAALKNAIKKQIEEEAARAAYTSQSSNVPNSNGTRPKIPNTPVSSSSNNNASAAYKSHLSNYGNY